MPKKKTSSGGGKSQGRAEAISAKRAERSNKKRNASVCKDTEVDKFREVIGAGRLDFSPHDEELVLRLLALLEMQEHEQESAGKSMEEVEGGESDEEDEMIRQELFDNENCSESSSDADDVSDAITMEEEDEQEQGECVLGEEEEEDEDEKEEEDEMLSSHSPPLPLLPTMSTHALRTHMRKMIRDDRRRTLDHRSNRVVDDDDDDDDDDGEEEEEDMNGNGDRGSKSKITDTHEKEKDQAALPPSPPSTPSVSIAQQTEAGAGVYNGTYTYTYIDTAAQRALPVYSKKEEILNAIRDNQVVLVAGETGSGKTTQVPAYVNM